VTDAPLFTNREIAGAIWLVGFIAVAAWRIPGLGRSLGSVVRAFLAWKIASIFAAGAVWAALSVAFFAWIGLWTVGELGTTIVWGLTFAGVTLLDANRATEDDAFYRKIARDTVAGTALVLFIAEFKSFPLWFELILVPVTAVLSGMKALAERDPQHAAVQRFIDVLLIGLALLVLGYAVAHAITAPGAFLSSANLRRFLIPVALSLMFLPFLAAVPTMMVYETTGSAMSLRYWHLRDPKLRRYALWRAFLAFGWNYDLLRRWKRMVMTLDPADRAAVDASIRRLQDRIRRERHPPPVPASEGWCPELARRFLDDHGLPCGYYDDLHGKWQASSPYRKFEGRMIPDNLAYYVVGDETAARRLTLAFNRNDLNNNTAAEAAFSEVAEQLAMRALGAAPEDTMSEEPQRLGDGWAMATRDEWERGYSRRLTLAKRRADLGFF
jgi:hypothetical protein